MIESGIDAYYLQAQRSFAELAGSLRDDEWATPVPCTPGWTARDVLSHVSGIPDDALAGRLDGVATEPWTASQVERNRAAGVAELLARWEEQSPAFAEAVASMGEIRPPIDCHSHEHDVRHALGRPGNRDSAIVHAAVASGMAGFGRQLVVELDDGQTLRAGGSTGPRVTLTGVSEFEVFRSRLGRRSAEQVRDYHWSGPDDLVAAVLADWFVFGPSDDDIVESAGAGRGG